MSELSSAEAILSWAKEQEKEYSWLGAAELYKKASDMVPKQGLAHLGEIQERRGYSFYRAAFQAETCEEFESRMQLATDNYENGAVLFERIKEAEMRAEFNNCKAMATYARSWLASNLSAKKEQLNESWRFEKEALKAYGKAADQTNVGKACINLMIFLAERLNIEWEAELRERIAEEALKCGERAVEIFSKIQDKGQLAQTYIITAYFYRNAAFAKDLKPERMEKYRQRALSFGQKAIEISENIDDAYLIGLSHLCLADARLDILGTIGLQEKEHYEIALRSGKLTKDNFLIANALFGLQYAANNSAKAQEDPDKAREEYKKLDRYWEDAFHHYSLASYDSGMAMAYFQLITTMLDRSRLEPDLENRRLLLKKSVELGYKGLEHAGRSGSMVVTFHITCSLAVVVRSLAKIEIDPNSKISLLDDSAKLVEKSIRILEQASAASLVEPKEVNLAFTIWTLARYQAELAKVEENIRARIVLFEKAYVNMRSARDHWLAWAKSPWASIEKPMWFVVGSHEMITGQTLTELYALTGNIDFLEASLDAFKASVNAYDKADVPTRTAEAYWQIAKAYDRLAEYSDSAKNFESASQNYRLAATKIPQLKEFYLDYATYMQAWNEIENAKNEHKREEYRKAKEHYEKTAELHNSTERWKYLSPNYLAWARLDEAEDSSREDKAEEAKNLFHQAAKLFAEAKKSIQAQLEKVETEAEKELLVNLTKATEIRREYSLGRIALEEAKILDRQGEHGASSEKYGYAAKEFNKTIDAMGNEPDREELEPIVYLCKAWQMMSRAEAEASPGLYLEASRLFEEAKEHSSSERARLLALGHSRFSQALEAGTRFEDAGDTTTYSTAKKHIEAAENYYLRASYKNASEYAKATCMLFDAYMYMHQAETETKPPNKTMYYRMAEKLLQSSAGSFVKANHPKKSEEVARFLESIKEKRQLAMSLTELLHAPAITSTTTSFPTPTPTHEEPVGFERFEQADIQGNLILRAKEARVGDDVDFSIELVNAGKAPASLVRVEGIIPEGFEIRMVPETYRIEHSGLNMKGKRLNPLSAEELRMVARPLKKGMFMLKPRVLYTDETGKYRSHELEPVMITVKELGIKGWLKGER